MLPWCDVCLFPLAFPLEFAFPLWVPLDLKALAQVREQYG